MSVRSRRPLAKATEYGHDHALDAGVRRARLFQGGVPHGEAHPISLGVDLPEARPAGLVEHRGEVPVFGVIAVNEDDVVAVADVEGPQSVARDTGEDRVASRGETPLHFGCQ